MKNKTKITIKDIAEKAGVSIATVSRVMNHKNSVTPETRQKILEVMEKLHFNPSSIFLTDNKSRTLLLCIPDFSNPFNELVIDGIQQAAYQNRYRVFILQSKETQLTFEDYEGVLKNHAFAGIILLTSVASPDLLELLNRSCPIVMCSEYCDVQDISFVSIDDITAAKKAVEYLIACGRRRIGLMNSSLRHNYARRREQGYREALSAAGLASQEDWIARISSIDYNLAYSYASNMLALPQRPDAFFAVSDVFAVAVIHAAKRMRLQIPQELSVIGFDNIKVSSMTDPSLTTIEQPCNQIGYQACELLIDKIKNPLSAVKRIILGTELILRESTAPFRDMSR